MRPHLKALRNGNSFTVPRLLLAFPLALAAFALVLQFSAHHPPPDNAAFGLLNEKEFIRRSDSLPRLERQIHKNRLAGKATAALGGGIAGGTKQPLPRGLGDESWAWPPPSIAGPKIAFTVTTAESVEQIRVWLAYHRALGVSLFYLFVEGQASSAEAQSILRNEPGVTVIPNDAALQERHAKSRIWGEHWLSAFFNKPCNHELFVKQSLNMEMGIEMARKDDVEWILHIDTDELIFPGGTRDYSLKQVLSEVPDSVDLLIFPNYEALAETTEVEDPLTEVSLFKRSYSHVNSDLYFKEYSTVSRGNPNYFTTYGNGKSAARIQPGLRPNGAHRWHSYTKQPVEWSSEQAAVLHYTYNRFSDLKSRRDRCDCQPTNEDAERCFILPFDRIAFLEASLKDDEELMKFFKARLVWEDSEEVATLVHKGLFVRLYAPQVMIRGLREAMRKEKESGAGIVTSSSTTKAVQAMPSVENKTAVEADVDDESWEFAVDDVNGGADDEDALAAVGDSDYSNEVDNNDDSVDFEVGVVR